MAHLCLLKLLLIFDPSIDLNWRSETHGHFDHADILVVLEAVNREVFINDHDRILVVLVCQKVEAECVLMTGLKGVAEGGKWDFNNSNELILSRLYLVPDFKPKSEFFKNLNVCS